MHDQYLHKSPAIDAESCIGSLHCYLCTSAVILRLAQDSCEGINHTLTSDQVNLVSIKFFHSVTFANSSRTYNCENQDFMFEVKSLAFHDCKKTIRRAGD